TGRSPMRISTSRWAGTPKSSPTPCVTGIRPGGISRPRFGPPSSSSPRCPRPGRSPPNSSRPGSSTARAPSDAPSVACRRTRSAPTSAEPAGHPPGVLRPAPYAGRMERRIFVSETECGVTCSCGGQLRLSPDEVARYLFRRVVHWGRSSNVFLENGARLYLDVGSHPEYATPEGDLIREVVAHDKAGERILEHLLAAAELRLHEEGIAGDVYLFKNNTDSAGNSYGCHENYLVARHGEFARMADVLIPFFVTRQIWCGAGKVLHGPRGAQYCIAQRAEHLWEGVSSAT